MKTGVVILSLSQLSPESRSAVPPGKKTALEAALLEALLDLVDRYWSGCKSLRGNEAFLGESGRNSCLSMQTHVWAHPPGSILLAGAFLLLGSGLCTLWTLLISCHCPCLLQAGPLRCDTQARRRQAPRRPVAAGFPPAALGIHGAHLVAWFCWKCFLGCLLHVAVFMWGLERLKAAAVCSEQTL